MQALCKTRGMAALASVCWSFHVSSGAMLQKQHLNTDSPCDLQVHCKLAAVGQSDCRQTPLWPRWLRSESLSSPFHHSVSCFVSVPLPAELPCGALVPLRVRNHWRRSQFFSQSGKCGAENSSSPPGLQPFWAPAIAVFGHGTGVKADDHGDLFYFLLSQKLSIPAAQLTKSCWVAHCCDALVSGTQKKSLAYKYLFS